MPRVSAKVKVERRAAFEEAVEKAWAAYHKEVAPFVEDCEQAIKQAMATKDIACSDAEKRLTEVLNKAWADWKGA